MVNGYNLAGHVFSCEISAPFCKHMLIIEKATQALKLETNWKSRLSLNFYHEPKVFLKLFKCYFCFLDTYNLTMTAGLLLLVNISQKSFRFLLIPVTYKCIRKKVMHPRGNHYNKDWHLYRFKNLMRIMVNPP